MKRIAGFFVVFLSVIAASVLPFNTASAQAGGYVGVFGGYTLSPDVSLWYYDDNYNHRYNYYYKYDVDVQKTGVFGIKFGYTPPPLRYFSFEFEYSYLNHDVDRAVLKNTGTDYTAIQGDAAFHNFMLNAIAKYPEGKIHPYIGWGLGFSYVDLSLQTTSSTGVNYGRYASNDDTVFAWQILVGVDIDLTSNLSMDIGFRYFATESGSYYDHEYDSTHLDYSTSMVTLGLKYRF
jgi:opacity protein-like surface antigen